MVLLCSLVLVTTRKGDVHQPVDINRHRPGHSFTSNMSNMARIHRYIVDK